MIKAFFFRTASHAAIVIDNGSPEPLQLAQRCNQNVELFHLEIVLFKHGGLFFKKGMEMFVNFEALGGKFHADRAPVMGGTFLNQIIGFNHAFDVIGNIGAKVIAAGCQLAHRHLVMAKIVENKGLNVVDVLYAACVQLDLDDFKKVTVQALDEQNGLVIRMIHSHSLRLEFLPVLEITSRIRPVSKAQRPVFPFFFVVYSQIYPKKLLVAPFGPAIKVHETKTGFLSMAWRDALLTREEQLEPYFKQVIAPRYPFPRHIVTFHSNEDKLHVQMFRRDPGQHDFWMFNFKCERRADSLCIKFVHALQSKFRVFGEKNPHRMGIMGKAYKCAIGYAHHYGLTRLSIDLPNDDGTVAWPHMGGIPDFGRKGLAIPDFKKKFCKPLVEMASDPQFPLHAEAKDQIKRFAMSHPLRTWQYASQLDDDIYGVPFYAFFFEKYGFLNRDFNVFLGERMTRLILKRRIGLIPEFEDSSEFLLPEQPVYTFPKSFILGLPKPPVRGESKNGLDCRLSP